MTQKRSELLELMSPTLKAEVAWQCNREWLSRVWFLKGASQEFLVQLALRLRAQVFAPSEECPAGKLYIIHRGVALYGGKVFGKGRVWGEDMILTSVNLQKPFSARAMIFLSVFTLSHDSLTKVRNSLPNSMLFRARCSSAHALPPLSVTACTGLGELSGGALQASPGRD